MRLHTVFHRWRTPARAALLVGSTGLAAAVSGCSEPPATPAVAASAQVSAARPVGYVTPVVGDVSRTITQPATIQGMEEATLYAKASGYLRTIFVDKGDRVRAGQVLAIIESPELIHQQMQARAAFRQSEAETKSVQASRGRAEADASQAAAAVERARADELEAAAVVARAKAEQAKAEAQVPKLQALIAEAEAGLAEAQETVAQAQVEVKRREQQVQTGRAGVAAARASLRKAEADARLQQVTYNRLKAIQDKDAGLVAAQDVDVARARTDAAQSEVEAARSRAEAAAAEQQAVEQQLEAARWQVSVAGKRVDAARSRLQSAREDVQIARKEIEAAEKDVAVAAARQASLGKQIGVVEGQQRALREQVRVVDAQITAARLQSAESRSAMSAAGALAGYTRIVAPFDGVVTERLADAGSFVQNAGSNQAAARGIVKVVSDRTLRVMVPVPEWELPRIRKGMPVTLAVDPYKAQEFRGVVTRFATSVDPKSRTMLTEIDIPNRDGRLRPGMYTRVTLPLETHRNALSIPTEAVMGKEKDRFVYTVADGKAKKTPVVVGVEAGKTVEITSGLEPGSQVVVVGRDTLVDGAAVKAEPAKLDKK